MRPVKICLDSSILQPAKAALDSYISNLVHDLSTIPFSPLAFLCPLHILLSLLTAQKEKVEISGR